MDVLFREKTIGTLGLTVGGLLATGFLACGTSGNDRCAAGCSLSPDGAALLDGGAPSDAPSDALVGESEEGPDASSACSDPAAASCTAGRPYACPYGSCPDVPVFELDVSGNPAAYELPCGWLSIRAPDGGVLGNTAGNDGCGAPLDCCSCTPQPKGEGCPAVSACVTMGPVGDASLRETWSGQINRTSVCGGSSSACTYQACAPDGAYLAIMCLLNATEPDSSTPIVNVSSQNQTCVQVPFALPSSGIVHGTIGPP